MEMTERVSKRQRCDGGTSSVVPAAGALDQAQDGDDDEVITLNVGGVRTQTRCSTLTWSSAYFRNVLSGPFKRNRGELFLDCDAAAFAHVLEFFRHRALSPNAPLMEVHSIAKLYCIDVLLEETAKRMEISSMVGTWIYDVPSMDDSDLAPTPMKYTIYEHDSALWFYERKPDGSTSEGQLVKDGDRFVVRAHWGALRLARRGHSMMSNYLPPGEAAWEENVVALRHQ